ncbi:hypothetical protein M378DRAFT_167970 [Amanita muscaria Koide BX008]|uniref:Uncharacterized protein n=1 Tax=Amanita muscaria (strain Koide BX008) TaxID=946122 RepID=A0A0C2WGN9_AMAMK|nr:hypothetical protein M378DRAFT_167970 [Amanita muscaria Koide BX008]
MKRRSEKAAVTSKVHRNELISSSSHTRLKEPQRAQLKQKASALKPHRTSQEGLCVLHRNKPNHAADIETKSLSHKSPTQVHSEPHISATFARDATRLCDSIQGVMSAISRLKERVHTAIGSHNLPRVQPSRSARSETRPPSPPSLSSHTRAQPRLRHSNTEPLEITQEGPKPSIRTYSHREQESKPAPSSQSDWRPIDAQMSMSLDTAESRLKSSGDPSRETLDPSQAVEPDTKTDNSLYLAASSRVHVENANSDSECHPLTREDSTSSHHTEIEFTETLQTMRADGIVAQKLSRVKLSPHVDVVLEPHKLEPENISPAPHSDVSDGCKDPCMWKPPDKKSNSLRYPRHTQCL